MYFLDVNEVLYIHDKIIGEFWWLSGIKDLGQIESILQHIQNDEYYKSFVTKLTHLFFWIIQFHPFNDGNKRTAILVTTIFLEMNDCVIPDIFVKLEDIAVWVAKWEIDKDTLEKFLKTLLISFDYGI